MTTRTQAAPAASTLETLPADAAAALVHLAGTLHVLTGEAQRNADATPTHDTAKLAELARDAVIELHAVITALDVLQAAPAASTLETLPADAAISALTLRGNAPAGGAE